MRRSQASLAPSIKAWLCEDPSSSAKGWITVLSYLPNFAPNATPCRAPDRIPSFSGCIER